VCGRSRFLEFWKQCSLLPLLSIVVVSQHITAACDVSGLVLQLLWSGIGMEASTTVGSETVRVQFRCAVITAAVRRDTSSRKQHVVRKLGQSGRTTQSVSDRGCMCCAAVATGYSPGMSGQWAPQYAWHQNRNCVVSLCTTTQMVWRTFAETCKLARACCWSCGACSLNISRAAPHAAAWHICMRCASTNVVHHWRAVLKGPRFDSCW
jgi:hypothetical protein